MNNRFEEMPVWQVSMDYAQEVFTLIAHETFANKQALNEQLQSHALSIINNIVTNRPKGAWAAFAQVKSMLYFVERFPEVSANCRAELDRVMMKSNELARLLSDLLADYVEEKPKYTRRDEMDDGPRCPKCGAPMRLRHGRNGNTFWGCSNYPACNGVLNVQRKAA